MPSDEAILDSEDPLEFWKKANIDRHVIAAFSSLSILSIPAHANFADSKLLYPAEDFNRTFRLFSHFITFRRIVLEI